jgi:long-chain acyl-CoA synthetase
MLKLSSHQNLRLRPDTPGQGKQTALSEHSTSPKRNGQDAETVFVSAERLLPRGQSFRFASYCTRHAKTFSAQAPRFAAICGAAALGPFLSLGSRTTATRLLHLPLRGMSQDRLDFLGEEFFQWRLRPQLHADAVAEVEKLVRAGKRVVLVGHELDHLLCPLARAMGAVGVIANRLEFRELLATGRLLDPVLPVCSSHTSFHPASLQLLSPAEVRARLRRGSASVPLRDLIVPLHSSAAPAALSAAFGRSPERSPQLSVRQTYAGKRILLLGATGFIGKVWLGMLLEDLPEVGKIYLLIRKSGSRPALGRFEKLMAECPVFNMLHERHGEKLGEYVAQRVEVIEGDISRPGLGLDEPTAKLLHATLDLVVNSSGQTDFNPDLRDALATNTDGSRVLLDFVRQCNHVALMHISTCFVAGRQDGLILEEIWKNQSPRHASDFDADRESKFLHDMIGQIERQAESPEITAQFRTQILTKHANQQDSHGHTLDEKGIQHRIRKLRSRWVRDRLIEFGIEQASRWGWPNIYTYTKALGEQILHQHGGDLPITMVRPSIVESALQQPFPGWNEGVNGTAPITFLVDNHIRQLPANPRQRMDVIPVDLVCRGMTLIGAALLTRSHEPVYQLATSGTNPAEVLRHMELACLAHRQHYWNTPGAPKDQRMRSDTSVVSLRRYRLTSVPMFRKVIERLRGLLARVGIKAEGLGRKQKLLERCEMIIKMYAPFIHDNEFHFAADNIKILSELLVDEERGPFDYRAEALDWHDYWINLHVPALRRWLYPVMEGRQPETGVPPRQFRMPARVVAAAPAQTILPQRNGEADVTLVPASRAGD